jgi:hypothetical protein
LIVIVVVAIVFGIVKLTSTSSPARGVAQSPPASQLGPNGGRSLPVGALGPSTGPAASLARTELAPPSQSAPVPLAAVTASTRDLTDHGGTMAPPGLLWRPTASPKAVIYASASGSDSGAGSASKPLSLSRALQAVKPGEEIHLSAGHYPSIELGSRYQDDVTISGAGDSTPPMIDGGSLTGASHIRFDRVAFTGQVTLKSNGSTGTDHVSFVNSEFDCSQTAATGGSSALFIRGGTSEVLISDVYIHNCVVGISTMDDSAPVSGLTLTHSVIQDLPGDAVDLGHVTHVVVDHDIIRGIADPKVQFHNDGIQFYGSASDVAITNNVLANSRDQLIFIQDAVAPPGGSRLNSNILVDNNLIYGAGGIAIQVQGGSGVRLLHNTVWDNHFSSLLMRRSSYSNTFPSDAVVLGNVIQGFGLMAGGPLRAEDYNLLTNVAPGYRPGGHDAQGSNPAFAGAPQGNFALTGKSVIDAGALAAALARVFPGQRAAGPGFDFGDSGLAFGAPRFTNP